MVYKKNPRSQTSFAANLSFIAGLVLMLTAAAFGQTSPMTQSAPAKPADQMMMPKKVALQPVMTDYKGVKIGMTADEVRDKLDKKPKVADKTGFYYIFSDNETAQIGLDKDKKVRVISAMYSGKDANAPKYEDVFGKDVPMQTKPNGRVYNLVRYPDAGFWVAYNRSAGDNPTTTVTIQKMRSVK